MLAAVYAGVALAEQGFKLTGPGSGSRTEGNWVSVGGVRLPPGAFRSEGSVGQLAQVRGTAARVHRKKSKKDTC